MRKRFYIFLLFLLIGLIHPYRLNSLKIKIEPLENDFNSFKIVETYSITLESSIEEESFLNYMKLNPTILELRKSLNMEDLKYHIKGNIINPQVILNKKSFIGYVHLTYYINSSLFTKKEDELYEYLYFMFENLEFKEDENIIFIPKEVTVFIKYPLNFIPKKEDFFELKDNTIIIKGPLSTLSSSYILFKKEKSISERIIDSFNYLKFDKKIILIIIFLLIYALLIKYKNSFKDKINI